MGSARALIAFSVSDISPRHRLTGGFLSGTDTCSLSVLPSFNILINARRKLINITENISPNDHRYTIKGVCRRAGKSRRKVLLMMDAAS